VICSDLEVGEGYLETGRLRVLAELARMADEDEVAR